MGALKPALAAATDAGADTPFDFDTLIARARRLAAKPYVASTPRYARLIDTLDYEVFMGIDTRPGHALWENSGLPFSVEFFHLDRNTPMPVAIHIVDNGRAHRLAYDPDSFTYPDKALAAKLPRDLGYGGFRLHDLRTDGLEWLAFKGASYFRSPGTLNQYGMSARGVAVNTGEPFPESFPNFTAFWLYKPAAGADEITICALLEGEHVTGAYQMRCRRPGDVVMDIQARIFQRDAVQRLGIAPLTSMYWYSETNVRNGADWRPEVHDSDGLAMATGSGERIWRALDNPPRADYSEFIDENPRGFGLLQRDRDFDHYQDSAVSFERRPSTWIEPKGDWGKGYVALFELSTAEEIYDNINVFWVPDNSSTQPIVDWAFDYRLYWTDIAPFPGDLARVVNTRTGRAGKPGTYDQQPAVARKFVIDFEGGPIADLDPDSDIAVVVSASQGRIVNPYSIPVGTHTQRWRAFFDWVGAVPPDLEAIVLHCTLAENSRTLTETWVYSYYPHPLPA